MARHTQSSVASTEHCFRAFFNNASDSLPFIYPFEKRLFSFNELVVFLDFLISRTAVTSRGPGQIRCARVRCFARPLPPSPRYPAKCALYWVFHRRVDWRGGRKTTFWKSTGKHARLRYLCTHPCMYIRIFVLIEYATDGDGKPFAGTTTVEDQ